MELDDLKSSWNSAVSQQKTDNELRLMLKENRHPVLKRIRKQITIETAGWLMFLLCYYTMFDGAAKPLIANVILVLAVFAALLHNLTGYTFSKNLVVDNDLNTALHAWLKKMKLHVTVSIILRIIFIAGLLAFFCWNITIDTRRYLLIGAVLIILFGQLVVLRSIWMQRIKALRSSLGSLS
ncbi:hypothetical protein [Mucilaginibacter sp. HD30]